MCKFVFVTWLNFREPITKIRQTDGPIFLPVLYWRCPEWSRRIFLEIFLFVLWLPSLKELALNVKDSFVKGFFFFPTLLLVCCTSHVSVRWVGSQSELRAFSQSVILNIFSCVSEFLINHWSLLGAILGEYRPSIVFARTYCVRSVLSRHRTDILSSY